MGIHFLEVTADKVVAELEIGPQHRQALGLVHGGVYCGMIETLASLGALLEAQRHGRSVVGLENHTAFVRAVRSGKIRGTATPIHRGRSTQIWEASVCDEQGRVLATGRVRLLCIDGDAALGRNG